MLDLTNKKSLYTIFTRKKRNGKKRIIHAPCEELKLEQKRLAKILEDREPISEHCYGFVKGLSSVSAASNHINKDWILCLDIKDFFPSIRREFLAFLTDEEFNIASLDDRLIQGSPCSPIITNIALREFDTRVGNMCKNMDIAYSRYADDITISGSGWVETKPLIDYIKNLLKQYGLKLRHEKTELMTKNESQKVLGINVNNKISINSKIRKNIRAAIHQNNIDEKVQGYLAYIYSVNKAQYMKLMKTDIDSIPEIP